MTDENNDGPDPYDDAELDKLRTRIAEEPSHRFAAMVTARLLATIEDRGALISRLEERLGYGHCYGDSCAREQLRRRGEDDQNK